MTHWPKLQKPLGLQPSDSLNLVSFIVREEYAPSDNSLCGVCDKVECLCKLQAASTAYSIAISVTAYRSLRAAFMMFMLYLISGPDKILDFINLYLSK